MLSFAGWKMNQSAMIQMVAPNKKVPKPTEIFCRRSK